jgi:hypothetical protein
MTARTFDRGQVWLHRSGYVVVSDIYGTPPRARLEPIYSPTIQMGAGRARYRNVDDVPPSWELCDPCAAPW